MYVIVCSIKPERGIIELFVIDGERQMTAVWQPRKYPKRCRIEKIIRGKSLDKASFVELAEAIPAAVGQIVKGKTVEELQALIGHTVQIEPAVQEEA